MVEKNAKRRCHHCFFGAKNAQWLLYSSLFPYFPRKVHVQLSVFQKNLMSLQTDSSLIRKLLFYIVGAIVLACGTFFLQPDVLVPIVSKYKQLEGHHLLWIANLQRISALTLWGFFTLSVAYFFKSDEKKFNLAVWTFFLGLWGILTVYFANQFTDDSYNHVSLCEAFC